MSLKILSLSEILIGNKDEIKSKEKQLQEFLNTFETISVTGNKAAQDVKNFLKTKAINFDKQGLSRTHLVISTFQGNPILVGYFTITNKPLLFTKRMLGKCSNSLKGRLNQKGEKMSNSENLLIQGFLIAQIGKNYSEEALKTKAVTGKDLLTLAYGMIDEAQKISAGSYVWVEYEDVDRLREFYKDFGFIEIQDHVSENGLRMAILKIK
ncbi:MULTISPECIES: hypothetical protein [Staphylococcus]|uniref:hypothetical protein n=1 Tax=Staphylococcus TaxID=1279 RepID=UPI00055A600E|nr:MULTISPECIES: hypothetical protein [Staphylococcus]